MTSKILQAELSRHTSSAWDTASSSWSTKLPMLVSLLLSTDHLVEELEHQACTHMIMSDWRQSLEGRTPSHQQFEDGRTQRNQQQVAQAVLTARGVRGKEGRKDQGLHGHQLDEDV